MRGEGEGRYRDAREAGDTGKYRECKARGFIQGYWRVSGMPKREVEVYRAVNEYRSGVFSWQWRSPH